VTSRRAKPAAVPPPPSSAQRTRAAELRSLIRDIAAGTPGAAAPPKTPREITDEAASRKMAAAKRAKRKRSRQAK
jgi:hypothetical protein